MPDAQAPTLTAGEAAAKRVASGWSRWTRPFQYPRLWLFYLGFGVLTIIAHQAAPVGLPQDVIYQVVGLASAAAIVVGIRLHRPVRTFPWYLMAAGQLIWSLADAVFSWDATILGNDRFPSPADPLYLAGYPIVAAGLYMLIRGRWPRRDVASLLDSAIVTAGLGLLSWVLLAQPTIVNYDESRVAAFVAVAYPIGDIIIVGLAIRLIATPSGRTTSLRLLLAAIIALIVVDTAASALDLMTFDSTDAINFLWLASYILWGASALHPSMYALSQATRDEDVRFTRKRLAALTLAVLVAPGILAAQHAMGVRVDVWPIVVGSVLTFLLVVARMNLAIDQIAAANRLRAIAQEALARQAAQDPLTDLPNRAEALRLITRALSRAERSGSRLGLLFLDLDGFKRVNDTLGHAAGDELLRVVARRMEANVRSGDVVARLGGDEFIALLEPLDEEASAVAVAERLVEAISAPILVAPGREVTVGVSAGVALSRGAQTSPEAMLHEADVAVYRAKASGRGRIEVFDLSIKRELDARSDLEKDLRAALAERDELVLHYQPIVHIVTGEVQGYEALVRWNRQGRGLLPPNDFIPVAEQSDLICDLDAWVLGRGLRQLAIWNQETSSDDLVLAVNLSARHIGRARVVDDVLAALEVSNVDPRQLVLEITETALIDDSTAEHQLRQLRQRGVLISIDDFGTGYSSIARLEHLPVDIVKVDRRFLDSQTRSAEILLRLIVQTAHALGLSVVAEGVENDEHLALLKSINCESAQGYFLGRPADHTKIRPERPGSGRRLLRPDAFLALSIEERTL